MFDPRIQRLASVLVDYSTCVQPNDRVTIMGEAMTAPLMQAVYEQELLYQDGQFKVD